jgi:hypothetical protein
MSGLTSVVHTVTAPSFGTVHCVLNARCGVCVCVFAVHMCVHEALLRGATV